MCYFVQIKFNVSKYVCFKFLSTYVDARHKWVYVYTYLHFSRKKMSSQDLLYLSSNYAGFMCSGSKVLLCRTLLNHVMRCVLSAEDQRCILRILFSICFFALSTFSFLWMGMQHDLFSHTPSFVLTDFVDTLVF